MVEDNSGHFTVCSFVDNIEEGFQPKYWILERLTTQYAETFDNPRELCVDVDCSDCIIHLQPQPPDIYSEGSSILPVCDTQWAASRKLSACETCDGICFMIVIQN